MKQLTRCRLPLAKRNAPQYGIFIAVNRLKSSLYLDELTSRDQYHES